MARMLDPDVVIAAADHPSLGAGLTDFLAGLRSEHRYFGPSARTNPKPYPSLIEAIGRDDGTRLVAVGPERVVGALRIADDGEVFVAVAHGHRRRGIGTELLEAALRHAGHDRDRLVIRASHRSEAVRRAAARVGSIAVDAGRGRVDLFLPARGRSTSSSA